jgi:hypothetical protein
VRIEERLMEDSAVEGEGTQHDAVHEHPSYQRGCGSFVEPRHTFFADGLKQALEGARETSRVGGLEADLDGIEGVTDWR